MRAPVAILVGEDNPHGGPPRRALAPLPVNSSGWRLCHKIIGTTPLEYMRRYRRVNLCSASWDDAEALDAAMQIHAEAALLDVPVVCLGEKVADAFGATAVSPQRSFSEVVYRAVGVRRGLLCQATEIVCAVLPHPSGRNRMWNDPRSIPRARDLLRRVGALEGVRLVHCWSP